MYVFCKFLDLKVCNTVLNHDLDKGVVPDTPPEFEGIDMSMTLPDLTNIGHTLSLESAMALREPGMKEGAKVTYADHFSLLFLCDACMLLLM